MLNKQTCAWLKNVLTVSNLSRLQVKKMVGGASSSMYEIKVDDKGQSSYFVLRQIKNDSWLKEEPDLIEHEKAALNRVLHLNVPTPQFIAGDMKGRACHTPSLLMKKLRGFPQLHMSNIKTRIESLAKCLSEIHNVNIDETFNWTYFPYVLVDELEIPSWTKFSKDWEDIFSYLKEKFVPDSEHVFIHRDFHLNNVLWDDLRLSGIVDWIGACVGPRGIDVGHCRWNLAMTHSIETADYFLEQYEGVTNNHFTYHPYWDVRALCDVLTDPLIVYPGWIDLGVQMTTDMMAKKMDDYMLSLLNRIK